MDNYTISKHLFGVFSDDPSYLNDPKVADSVLEKIVDKINIGLAHEELRPVLKDCIPDLMVVGDELCEYGSGRLVSGLYEFMVDKFYPIVMSQPTR